jgi:hypothetical protein
MIFDGFEFTDRVPRPIFYAVLPGDEDDPMWIEHDFEDEEDDDGDD